MTANRILKDMVLAIIVLTFYNFAITNIIDRYKNDSLTEMQAVKRTHQTFFWNFKLK